MSETAWDLKIARAREHLETLARLCAEYEAQTEYEDVPLTEESPQSVRVFIRPPRLDASRRC